MGSAWLLQTHRGCVAFSRSPKGTLSSRDPPEGRGLELSPPPCSLVIFLSTGPQTWLLFGQCLPTRPRLLLPVVLTNSTAVSAGSDSVTIHKAPSAAIIKLYKSKQPGAQLGGMHLPQRPRWPVTLLWLPWHVAPGIQSAPGTPLAVTSTAGTWESVAGAAVTMAWESSPQAKCCQGDRH